MHSRAKAAIAVTGAALVLAAGSGGALAAGVGGGPGSGGKPAAADRGPGGPAGAAAVATYLGLTQAELRTQLESGKTLAQVAEAQGKSVSGLKDAIYADAKSHLDQAVADGRITAAQETTRLADLKSHLDEIVNRSGPPPRGKGPHGGPGGPAFGAGAVATYLGLTPAQLGDQLKSGKSLAQVAAAQGKTVDGLKAAILAAAKTRLDKAVAAGKLTAAQETAKLAELQSKLDDIVNHTGPPPRHP